MAKRPFLLLYINDFLSSVTVMAMDDQQFAWYLKLLMRAWQNEPACRLPNDDEKLMMAAGCKIRKIWDRKKQLVLSNFDASEDKNWLTNARLIGEYVRMCEVSEKKREAGKRGGQRKQQNLADATRVLEPATAQPSNSDVRSQMSEVKQDQKQKPAPLALPDWLPLTQWQAFLEMRKKKKAPNTDYALGLVIGKLDEYRNKGQPPEKVLELAIQSAWSTVWPLKDSNHQQQPETKMKSAKQVIEDRKK